jgi:hypothetical protein
MAQDVVNLLFAGDSVDLLPRYAAGARRYREAGGQAPEQVVVAHCDAGLHVTLVWPEAVSHEQLGRHMLDSLEELGLSFPRLDHGTLASASWESLTAAGDARTGSPLRS